MKVITANRLLDGEVVWFGPQGKWVEVLDKARVFEDASELQEVLQSYTVSEERQEVVGVYEIDVTFKNGRLTPTRLREVIRARGPTTHPYLGKQARPVSSAA